MLLPGVFWKKLLLATHQNCPTCQTVMMMMMMRFRIETQLKG